MFAALLKHEARLQTRTLASYLGISLAVYASGMALMLLRIPLLASLGSIAAIGAPLLLAIGVPALLLQRYYASMYGREGYFTHALPAKHTTLYGAKFSWALVVWLAALLIALGMALGFFVGQTVAGGGTASDAWAVLGEALAGLSTGTTILLAMWFVIAIVTYVAQFGWIVTFGMEERFRPMGLGGPVLVWFISYAVLQVVTLVSLVAIPIGVTLELDRVVFASFVPELIEALNGAEPSFLPLGWLPVLLATIPVYIVWTLRSIGNHTSLR